MQPFLRHWWQNGETPHLWERGSLEAPFPARCMPFGNATRQGPQPLSFSSVFTITFAHFVSSKLNAFHITPLSKAACCSHRNVPVELNTRVLLAAPAGYSLGLKAAVRPCVAQGIKPGLPVVPWPTRLSTHGVSCGQVRDSITSTRRHTGQRPAPGAPCREGPYTPARVFQLRKDTGHANGCRPRSTLL